MRHGHWTLLSAALVVVAGAVLAEAPALAGQPQADEKQTAGRVPVEALEWFATGIGPLQAAMAHGDLSEGPYGAFLKLPAGFETPAHHHSADYRAVVVTGTVVNSEAGQADIPMRPGSYWHQRGGANHVTKCVSPDDCTVYVTQGAGFDFLTE